MKSLLIVDDEPDLRVLLSVMAEQEGYHTLVAGTGAEALEHLEQGAAPSAIVLDLMMPEMSGFQFCRLVKARPEFADIPILVLTARNQAIDRFRAEDSGADAYVTKPFEIDDILDVLKRFERDHRAK